MDFRHSTVSTQTKKGKTYMLGIGTKVYAVVFDCILDATILENKQIELTKDEMLQIAHLKLEIGGEMDVPYSNIFTDKMAAAKCAEKYEE